MFYKIQKAFVQHKNIFFKTLYKLVQHVVEKNKILYNMSLLEILKHYFDISNTSIAHLIGASSSLIHSVSSGRRSLSLYHIQPLVLLPPGQMGEGKKATPYREVGRTVPDPGSDVTNPGERVGGSAYYIERSCANTVSSIFRLRGYAGEEYSLL